MEQHWITLVGFLMLFTVLSGGTCLAGTEDGSGMSYWGEIPVESQNSRSQILNNSRPLWEDMIFYPYTVVAWPMKIMAGSVGSGVAWASNPKIYNTVSGIVTLDFVPVEGRVGLSIGGGDGVGASYSMRHNNFLGDNNRMKLGLGRTSTEKTKATLGFLFADGQPNSLATGIGYRLKPNSRYFGIGYDSPESRGSYFTSEASWFGASYFRRLGQSISLETTGMYSAVATRGSWSNARKSIEYVFPSSENHPVGFGEESGGNTFSLGLRRDTTIENGRPNQGGVQRCLLSVFNSTDDSEVQFWSERIEFQQFIPLWHTRRSLALRGLFYRLHETGDGPIPFQRLLTNDDPDQFRGYSDLRFRDSGLIAFSAEYRFPAWNYRRVDGLGLDAFLFADLGQVFNEPKEIALRNLTESYGGGFRFLTRSGFGGRLEVGFSEEEMVFRLSAQQTFQFGKGGLHNGLNPIPRR